MTKTHEKHRRLHH
ncbi:bacterial regulatory helix-turn-helix, lysR family protein, partial [Vibrio parahaemolyticus EKP-008]